MMDLSVERKTVEREPLSIEDEGEKGELTLNRWSIMSDRGADRLFLLNLF